MEPRHKGSFDISDWSTGGAFSHAKHASVSVMVPRDGFQERHPLLPLKNVVVFPRNVVTLLVGRPRSVRAVDQALAADRHMIVTAHRDPDNDEPRPEDLHHVGTLVAIVSSERQSAGNVQVVLEGICRVRISDFASHPGFFTVLTEPFEEPEAPLSEARALISHVQNLTNRFADARGALPVEVQDMVQRASDPSHLADLLATQLLTDVSRRQALLEISDPLRRLEHVAIHLSAEIDVAALERRIKDRVRDQIDRNQREYYLREQLKAIHDELGGENGNEFDTLKSRIAERGMPAPIEDRVLKEVARLERMPGVSAEATVVRTYLDTVLALPWHESSTDRLDLREAERILDADHFGLDAVKERILDFLAVRKLTVDASLSGTTQILCLVGPPGVGKTSLGRSIATAMGRNFVRVSLGGVRDEAEIRGHRRTYIGAMPGRIISAMKQAGTLNPVLLLDEIDKLSSDYRGDPASAMLEVLDPEQNRTFSDHFLDLPYDLSRVLFLTTANNMAPIPRPLRDRMEVIEIPGYTEEEKGEIGRKYLLPKQISAHGLAPKSIIIPAKTWVRLVRDYTREAGVRQLERELAAICRRLAREVVRGKGDRIRLTEARLAEFLGPPRYGQDLHLGEDQIGLAIGLGVTEIGGELLPVEVATMPGKGSLTITGKAGDVMQESAHAAVSYARSRAEQLRIDPDFQSSTDLHIHLPEGATPKDGPSAGITMATALISALTRRPVRGDTAMTGEITLRGRVLAVGGFREKALAAHRHGIRRLIAPKENARDLSKLSATVRRDMEIVFAVSMDQVIAAAIRLDDTQVGGLLEGIEPATPAPAPEPMAASSSAASKTSEDRPEAGA
jgi:ATP-dependent Lon protease